MPQLFSDLVLLARRDKDYRLLVDDHGVRLTLSLGRGHHHQFSWREIDTHEAPAAYLDDVKHRLNHRFALDCKAKHEERQRGH